MYMRQGWPERVEEPLKIFSYRRHELTIEGDVLLWGMRVVVPSRFRNVVLQELHQGHQGIVRMKGLAPSHVWWPNIDRDLEKVTQGCSSCQQHKNAPAKAPLNLWSWPDIPWDRIHVDFAGPVSGKMLFVMVDSHSNWPEVCIMNETSADKTIAVLRDIFARNGLPRELVSDNGPQFTSQEFTKFMSTNGIRHVTSSPYHLASNGAVERFVQTVKKVLCAGEKDGMTLEMALATFILQYRNTPHPTTGLPPSSLFVNRVLCTRLDLLRPDVGNTVRNHQSRQKIHHDQHSQTRSFMVEQHVWVRNFRDGPRWMKGIIAECVGPVLYRVQMSDGAVWRKHVDHIRGGKDNTQENTCPTTRMDQSSFFTCPTPLADSSDTQATSVVTADQFPGSEPIAEPITESGHHTAVSPTPAASPCPPAETVRTYPMRSRRPPLWLYGTMDT